MFDKQETVYRTCILYGAAIYRRHDTDILVWGRLEVESTIGRGTVVTIILPQ